MARSSTSWKPGQTGNPNGTPKKDCSITSLMKQYLNHVDPDKKKTYKQIFIEKVLELVQKGDSTAIRLLWNYMDGMPLQSVKVEKGANPILKAIDEIKNNNNTNISNDSDD